MEIVAVPVLSDNYAWLIYDPKTEDAVAVDPGEAAPVLAAAKERGWHVSQVWTTHWHPDHTGGNADMKRTGVTITGPHAEKERIPTLDTFVREGDVIRLGSHTGKVLAVPGHTAGHIAFHFADDAILFTGDTLFAMGCGKLFEGTPAQMWENMERYAAMPADTVVYCGHEYTKSNAAFAAHVEPDNQAITDRRAEDGGRCDRRRGSAGRCRRCCRRGRRGARNCDRRCRSPPPGPRPASCRSARPRRWRVRRGRSCPRAWRGRSA
ncbi:MAG: hydroxyacylglutathione hydrolase [Sphingomonas sp.]|nr:MAG: hydroxyacylglutathione hydrolase [Sphingomonas sp.]